MAIRLSAGKVILKGGKVACSCCCPTTLPAWQHDSVGKSFTKCGYQSSLTAPESYKRWLKVSGCYAIDPLKLGMTAVRTTDPVTCVETVSDITCNVNCLSTFGWPYLPTPYYNFAEDKYYKKVTKTWTGHCNQSCPDRTVEWSDAQSEVQDIVPIDEEDACWEAKTTYSGTSSSLCTIDGYTISCSSTRDPVTGAWSGTIITPEGSYPTEDRCHATDCYSTSTECTDDCPPDVFTAVWEGEIVPPETVYENEYLTDALIANVRAAIAAEGFDGDWNDTGGSYRNLGATEESYSERQDKARLPLTGLDVTLEDGKTYNAIWVVRFTPLGGGATVDGAEQTLAITFATGMTHSAPVTIPVPDENGTNDPILLRWECPEPSP